ncbi:DinI-like family protein [Escherichia coli]
MRIEIIIDKEQKISQSTLDALESELYRNLRPLYPKTVIRIRKGSSNGVELTGLQLDEERKQVMKIMQKVWEDDSLAALRNVAPKRIYPVGGSLGNE